MWYLFRSTIHFELLCKKLHLVSFRTNYRYRTADTLHEPSFLRSQSHRNNVTTNKSLEFTTKKEMGYIFVCFSY